MAREDDLRGWKRFGGKVGQHCKNCEERFVGCHSTCEKYLEAKGSHDRYVEKVRKAKKERANQWTPR